jgi:hypothetical protein
VDEPTPSQPAEPTSPKLARALTASFQRSGERTTVLGWIATAGMVVVLAGALAVGIGALALHKNDSKNPKTTNAADGQIEPSKGMASSPQDGAPVPVPIAPPGGKAAPKKKPGGHAVKASPGARKSTASKGSTLKPPTRHSSGQTTTFSKATIPTATIVSYASGKCIDVTNEGQTGVPIQIWDCGPVTDWKRWAFYSDGTIRSQGHCMTVAGGSGNGTPIEVMPCNGGSSQRFNLNNAHDLVNVAADKCVDVKDKQTANGTKLQLWSCGGTSNQKWHT